jgi:hypothetical protein
MASLRFCRFSPLWWAMSDPPGCSCCRRLPILHSSRMGFILRHTQVCVICPIISSLLGSLMFQGFDLRDI